jgi:hypothetical protein
VATDESRPQRVYLHIGAPKTGTTYIQALLTKNRDALLRKGILYPDSKAEAHHKAVWDLRGTPSQREGTKGIEGSWQTLVDRVNGADTDVVLSSEHFVFALPPHIRTALAAFAGDVHVIYTARDLGRQVPAVWQERIKNNQTMSFREYIDSITGEEGPGFRSFWGAQHAARVLGRWGGSLDPAHVHVVTAPPAGQPPTVLWDRFASVLGLAGGDFETETEGTANVSLSMLQTELLRRYNLRHGQGIPWTQYRRLIRKEFGIFAAIEDGRKISLTRAEHDFFAGKAAEINRKLSAKGYDVVGDLSDLAPDTSTAALAGGGEDPEELSDSELLAAALDVMQGLLIYKADEKQTTRELRQEARAAKSSGGGAAPTSDA